MKPIHKLSDTHTSVLQALHARIAREFPAGDFRMTIYGFRARGDVGPDLDMDVMIKVDTEEISAAGKQRVSRIVGEVSLGSVTMLSIVLVDRQLKRERRDYSIFHNIRDEGIRV